MPCPNGIATAYTFYEIFLIYLALYSFATNLLIFNNTITIYIYIYFVTHSSVHCIDVVVPSLSHLASVLTDFLFFIFFTFFRLILQLVYLFFLLKKCRNE